MSQGSESDHHMAFISQPCPEAHTRQIVPQQGEAKRRRRRKKAKSDEGSSMKRKLSAEQVSLLELNFGSERKLESDRKKRLASDLGLDPRQVAVWFQNRRARWKTKKLEEEYYKLKSAHDDVVLHKCWLESQVLELKEQLAEAEGEIRRLSASEVAGNSPSSSQSGDVTSVHGEQILRNGWGMDGFDDVLYMPAQDYIYCSDLWI